MLKTFKENNPYNTFLLFIYGFLLKLVFFIHPTVPSIQKTDGFLFEFIINKIAIVGNGFPLIYPIIAYLLLFTQAISFNRLVAEHRLFFKSNYLTAMTYLLITSMFSDWNVLSAPLILNTLLIWVWSKMSGMYNNNNPKATLFNIGLVIGIATFFYFPSISFAVLIVFGLILTRPFRIAEWLIALLGIIAPYYFVLSIAYLNNSINKYPFPKFQFGYPIVYESNWVLGAIIGLLLTLFIGFFYVQKNLLRQLVQTRKSWNLTTLYFLVAFIVPFINVTHSFSYWILCAVPLSAFIAGAFVYPQKKAFPRILHWAMVLFVIAFSYFVG